MLMSLRSIRASLTVSAIVLPLLMVAPIQAAPGHPPFGSFVNSSGVPAGSTLIMNVTYSVTNDEDSGDFGYWALDNFNKQLQVWQGPDKTSYYVVARYTGSFTTFAGALSPGAGAPVSKDATGQFEGGYVATFTFTGAFNPGGFKTNGNIGTYDFGGTKADVLLQTYGNTQQGSPHTLDVLSLYFPGYASFNQTSWGWTYHYRSQSWNNFSTGNSGDIVP
jgi:hypothetical protein